MGLNVFEEKPNVHEEVEVAGLLELVVLLCGKHKKFVFGVLSGEDVHFCVVEGTLDDVQFEGREAAESEVAYLTHLVLSAFHRKRGSLEVEGQVEGVAQLSIVESIKLPTTVFAVSNNLLSLTHQAHVKLNQSLVLI